MVKQTPFTALMNSMSSSIGELSGESETMVLTDDNPKSHLSSSNRVTSGKRGQGLDTLLKQPSLRNVAGIEDTPISSQTAPTVASRLDNAAKARFSISLTNFSQDEKEIKKQQTGRTLGGKVMQSMSKTVNTFKSPKKRIAPEAASHDSAPSTPTTTCSSKELKAVNVGSHLELHPGSMHSNAANLKAAVEKEREETEEALDSSDKQHQNQTSERAPGRLRRTASRRQVGGGGGEHQVKRNSKPDIRDSTSAYNRQRSKSRNGRAERNRGADNGKGRSKSQDKAANDAHAHRRGKLNRSQSERHNNRKLQRSGTHPSGKEKEDNGEMDRSGNNNESRRVRSKSRDRTVRRTRSTKKLQQDSNNSVSESGSERGDKSKRDRSGSRTARRGTRSAVKQKALDQQHHEQQQQQKSEKLEHSNSDHSLSTSEHQRRARSSSRTRRSGDNNNNNNKMRRDRSNRKLNNSIGDMSTSKGGGHSRSSRLALKRAASLMTNAQKDSSNNINSSESTSNTRKTNNNNNNSTNNNEPTRGVARASSVKSQSSFRSTRSEGSFSERSGISHSAPTINAQPRRRISRPTLKRAMSQSTLWARRHNSGESNSRHSQGSFSSKEPGTVEAVGGSRDDDETLEEDDEIPDEDPRKAAFGVPSPSADTISIDESVTSQMDREMQQKSMAILKEKMNMNLSNLIPNLDHDSGGSSGEHRSSHPLEALINTDVLDSMNSMNPMDEDSTIVSMNSVERASAIERAVQEAFEEALQAAVKQHTQSISNTAANHLMQRLRRDGAPIFD